MTSLAPIKHARFLFVSLLLLTLMACAGQRARQHAMFPAMDNALPAILEHAERGGANAELIDAFAAAVAERQHDGIIFRWPEIQAAAIVGIEARVETGEIGPGVAISLKEPIKQFDEAVQRLATPPS